jgi:7-cyano-7-deazaguanine synthase
MSKLVILSGGADSAICAAIAKQTSDKVHAITFDYGQRHKREIDCASVVSDILGLNSHEIINIPDVLKSWSPLLSDIEVENFKDAVETPEGIASTFVPMRNALFLTIAFNRAIALDCESVVTGVCQTDYSGYPDCRQVFITTMAMALNLAAETNIKIETPLMYLTKAESIKLAVYAMEDKFTEVLKATHTCYKGVIGGCGECAACVLRDRGFQEAGIDDPIWQFRNQ